MKKETKKLIENIVSYVVAVAIIIAIPVLTGVIIYREFQHKREVVNLLREIGDARAEADSYEVISEIFEELYEEKNAEVKELRKLKEMKSHRVYIKVEDDGDFELIWKDDKGWNYLQILGGIVVEEKCFGFVDEQFIDGFLGSRLVEFYEIP
jgi:hypothetical protein